MVSTNSSERKEAIRRLPNLSKYASQSPPHVLGLTAPSQDLERAPESRKLELNAYLTKPTTRLARYPLLLEVILKYTPDNHPDKIAIPKAVKLVREFLSKVNIESGKSENRFNLAQLDQQLVFRPGEAVVSHDI